MKKQVERPDVYLLPLTFGGDEIAARIHQTKEEIGHRVVDTFEDIKLPGYDPEYVTVRRLEVYGKRPGEGVIAADMKARRES